MKIKLYRFLFSFSLKEKKKIFVIGFLKFKVDFILRFVPLKKYLFKYFENTNNLNQDLFLDPNEIKLIKRVLKNLPGGHTCLNESIIVHLYFKRKSIYVPLLLGINTNNNIQAHAWYCSYEALGYNQFVIQHGKEAN